MRHSMVSRLISLWLALMLIGPGLASGQSSAYIVGPQDVLKVYVFDHPELSTDAVVSADGYIFLPLVGDVSVGGLSIREVEEVLTEAFGAYIVDPKVTAGLAVETQKRVYVLGQVVHPGALSYIERGRLTEYVARAGGFTPGADLRRTRITRLGSEEALVYYVDIDRILEHARRDLDIEMEAGDTIYVPETLLSRLRRLLPLVGTGVGIVTAYVIWETRR
jgi:polysaccharide export outer membrane protein